MALAQANVNEEEFAMGLINVIGETKINRRRKRKGKDTVQF